MHSSTPYAGTGHDRRPKYGGVVHEVRNVTYELKIIVMPQCHPL